jgi:ActR/RegA family two-component response regulator
MHRHPLTPHPFGMLVHTFGICGWPLFPWLPGFVAWMLSQITPLPPQPTQATNLYTLIGVLSATILPFVYAYAMELLRKSERESKVKADLEVALKEIADLKTKTTRTDEKAEQADVKATIAASTAAAVKAKAEVSNQTLKKMGEIPPPRNPETQHLLRNTLLIVEDDAQGMLQLGRFFERRGYEITTAACFEEAIAAIDEPGRDPHWAIIDLRMPGGNGLDILRKLRDEQKQTRVIVCTGHTDDDTQKQVMDLGAIEFIEKPTRPDRLWRIMCDRDERDRKMHIEEPA